MPTAQPSPARFGEATPSAGRSAPSARPLVPRLRPSWPARTIRRPAPTARRKLDGPWRRRLVFPTSIHSIPSRNCRAPRGWLSPASTWSSPSCFHSRQLCSCRQRRSIRWGIRSRRRPRLPPRRPAARTPSEHRRRAREARAWAILLAPLPSLRPSRLRVRAKAPHVRLRPQKAPSRLKSPKPKRRPPPPPPPKRQLSLPVPTSPRRRPRARQPRPPACCLGRRSGRPRLEAGRPRRAARTAAPAAPREAGSWSTPTASRPKTPRAAAISRSTSRSPPTSPRTKGRCRGRPSRPPPLMTSRADYLAAISCFRSRHPAVSVPHYEWPGRAHLYIGRACQPAGQLRRRMTSELFVRGGACGHEPLAQTYLGGSDAWRYGAGATAQ
mmetsp:Transcript_24189/g.78067  ORF Transcript_24189/g.78067 Transcript_24189/m.78067 type:complete len:383 (+) Transcript_24189:694-1842(+)